MEVNLDEWQRKFLETCGDKVLCTGRQVGKSEVCSMDAGRWATSNAGKTVLMIAPVERQAFALFDKTLSWLLEHQPRMVKKGRDRPTKSRIKLTNGTTIWCLPTGLSGLGIRFLTVHRLYADEASRIPDEVWSAVTPMLLTTGGNQILLSTPFGKGNRFADVVTNKDGAFDSFTRFHTNSMDVVRSRAVCKTWSKEQRESAVKLLEQEKARMTALEYAQEYEGQLVDELRQFFPTELIKKVMVLSRTKCLSPPNVNSSSARDTFLGVDVARMGRDDSVLMSLALENSVLSQVDMIITTKTHLTDTVRRIKNADRRYDYRKIYIDDGGLGVGVFDPLLEDSQTKRKVVAINNSSRSIDKDKRRKRLLKEDLYNNLLSLMEQARIRLWEDDALYNSMTSIQAEYTDSGKLRIFGSDSHITEALIRAAWCVKDKGLNIWIC